MRNRGIINWICTKIYEKSFLYQLHLSQIKVQGETIEQWRQQFVDLNEQLDKINNER